MTPLPRAQVKSLASRGLVAVVLLASVGACSPQPRPSGSPDSSAGPVSSAFPGPTPSASAGLSIADAEACPRTQPIRAAAVAADMFGAEAAAGNDALWVGGIGDDGIILADPQMVDADGFVSWKFGWWRIVEGSLAITGRRLDADAGPLRSSVPSGYGSRDFQSSGVTFPTEGCWEITGTVGAATLTFVVFVLKAKPVLAP